MYQKALKMYNHTTCTHETAFNDMKFSSSDMRDNYVYLFKYAQAFNQQIMPTCIHSDQKAKQTFDGSYKKHPALTDSAKLIY